MERPIRIRVALFVAVFGSACGQPSTDEPLGEEPRGEDAITESTPSATAESDDPPLFRVGWSPDDPTLQVVGSGFVTPSGGAVIADHDAATLYLLDSLGTVTASVGGRGSGPAEFQQIRALVPLGADSFLVSDEGNRRVTVFDGADYAYDLRSGMSFGEALYDPVGRTSGGHYVLAPGAFFTEALSVDESWRDYPVLSTRDFSTYDTVANLALARGWGPGARNPVRQRGVVVLSGDRIGHLTTERAEIEWLDVNGARLSATRWASDEREVSAEDWDRYEEGLRQRRPAAFGTERFERMIEERREYFSGVVPLFRRALADDVGRVWLSRYDFIGGGVLAQFATEYDVISADGLEVETRRFPRPIRLLDVAGDRALGVELDEFDVQAVAMYALSSLSN